MNKIKKILNKFYFIGTLENQENFFYILSNIGINKYDGNANISKKYFKLRSKKINKSILSKNQLDMEIYKYAANLNKNFIKNHKNFYKTSNEIGGNYKKKSLSQTTIEQVMQKVYSTSGLMRKKSKTYSKLVDLIKSKRKNLAVLK